jgi:hypothetical protein
LRIPGASREGDLAGILPQQRDDGTGGNICRVMAAASGN